MAPAVFFRIEDFEPQERADLAGLATQVAREMEKHGELKIIAIFVRAGIHGTTTQGIKRKDALIPPRQKGGARGTPMRKNPPVKVDPRGSHVVLSMKDELQEKEFDFGFGKNWPAHAYTAGALDYNIRGIVVSPHDCWDKTLSRGSQKPIWPAGGLELWNGPVSNSGRIGTGNLISFEDLANPKEEGYKRTIRGPSRPDSDGWQMIPEKPKSSKTNTDGSERRN